MPGRIKGPLEISDLELKADSVAYFSSAAISCGGISVEWVQNRIKLRLGRLAQ